MNSSNRRIATVWQRALTVGVGVLLAGVSVTAAVLGGGQETRQEVRDVVIETGDGPGAGPGLAEAAQSAPVVRSIPYTNAVGAPVVISSAEIRRVPAEQVARAMVSESRSRRLVIDMDGAGTAERHPAGGMPERRPFPPADADGNTDIMLVVLQNTSDRSVGGYQISGTLDTNDKVFFMFRRPIEPGQSFTIAVPVLDPLVNSPSTELAVKGAQFTDGSTWGEWQDEPGSTETKSRRR